MSLDDMKAYQRNPVGRRRRRHLEDDFAITVADYLKIACPDVLWWHTPNGGKRGELEAKRFKRMGVLPGVADLTFILPAETFKGNKIGIAAFIELKTEDGTQDKEQVKFQTDVENRGAPYEVCRTLEEVALTLESWGIELKAKP